MTIHMFNNRNINVFNYGMVSNTQIIFKYYFPLKEPISLREITDSRSRKYLVPGNKEIIKD